MSNFEYADLIYLALLGAALVDLPLAECNPAQLLDRHAGCDHVEHVGLKHCSNILPVGQIPRELN